MRNDLIPIIHKFDKNADGITIIPLADVHYGSADFNSVRWHEAVKRVQDDPNCYCVLVGDMIDNGLKNSLTNVYEQTASPLQQKKWLMEELKPIKNKILCAVGGNHERRSMRDADIDPMYDVMLSLGLEDLYRPTIAFMSVGFNRGVAEEDYAPTYRFAITHGSGGGSYVGSSANRVQTFGSNIEGIDGIITGHTHKPVTFPVSKLVFDASHRFVQQKQFVVVVASSFLDYGGYPVEKLLPPTAHTLTEIKLSGNQHRKEIRVLQ